MRSAPTWCASWAGARRLRSRSRHRLPGADGDGRGRAAGADIKEMKDKSYQDVFLQDFITVGWEKVSQVRKPIIAACRVTRWAVGARWP